MTDSPILSVSDLTVDLARDGIASRVLDGITFELFAGEIAALVGESGSGKSTIGKAVQGLLPPSAVTDLSGSIQIMGEEVIGASPRALRWVRRSLVRSIPQTPMVSLNPTMKIASQLTESGADRVAAERWLARTGLPDPPRILRSYPHQLSGGQRQRVMIAMAMVARPSLIIADEPTTALDVTVQAQILDLIRSLRGEGTSVLFVTHDLGVAAGLADRILVCQTGRIVEAGAAQTLLTSPSHAYSQTLLAARFDLESDRDRPLPTSTGPSADPWPAPAPASAQAALELFQIEKSFFIGPRDRWGRRAPRKILDRIDLRIDRGDCVALVGESGSGKSTLLRIAAGLETPDFGDVFRGSRVPPQVVFQDAVSALTPWLSIGSQISERLRAEPLSPAERTDQVAEAMTQAGLDPALAKALPSELSGGQCQRAVVARALVRPPDVLLCDEPISAMDVSLAAQILNLLNALRRELGIGILFITHDLAAARIIADRIAVLDEGKIVEEGPSEKVTTAPAAAYTAKLLAAVPRLPRHLATT